MKTLIHTCSLLFSRHRQCRTVRLSYYFTVKYRRFTHTHTHTLTQTEQKKKKKEKKVKQEYIYSYKLFVAKTILKCLLHDYFQCQLEKSHISVLKASGISSLPFKLCIHDTCF